MYKIWKDEYDKNKYIQEQEKYIRAVGGDGTLLRAIKMHRDKNKPFFGVGAGSVNFLMNDEPFIAPDVKLKKFRLIKVMVTYKSYHRFDDDTFTIMTEEFQAFNDLMIGGNMNSWIEFNVHDKDRIVRTFKGGGLIVSTAQGSTGINKNNGGVILPLSSHNWSITGDKTNRNINYVLEPHKTKIDVQSRTPITVWVDGSNNVVKNVQSIEISKGDNIYLMFNNYDHFKKKRM
jgi:NAD+ kinase